MTKQRENIKVVNLPFCPGVEAIIGNHIGNAFRRHIHQSYIIGMVEKGRRKITHADGSASVSENELFVLNPGQVHSCRSETQSGHSYRILSVSAECMRSIACQISEKHEKRPLFKKILYKDEKLSGKIKQLFYFIEAPESDIQVESHLYAFLSNLIMSYSISPPLIFATGEQKEAVKRACDYIQENFSQNLTLKKLAEVACLSPFHFQREFRKSLGITPHEYLSDFRIRESKKMLLNSEDIADIAIQCGFYDQSHFSKIFRSSYR